MAGIWPRLKKKLTGDGRQKKKKSGKGKSRTNPFAASGLEKFATVLEGIQAKKGASLVERTASSVSAARSISRSAQEWTAATLARSASRRSSEPRLEQCAAFEALAPKPATLAIVGSLEKDLKNLSEERQPQGSHTHVASEEVSCSPPEEVIDSVPVGVSLPERTSTCRSMKAVQSLHQQGWRQPSKSAFVVLFTMGTCLMSRLGKMGKPLAAVLTFSAVIQIWRKGKVSAQFMFSSVALYFLTPLRSYLLTRIPTRLNSKVVSSTIATEEETRVDAAQEQQDTSLGFPATPLKSTSSQTIVVKESLPLSILLPIPESSASVLGIGSLPVTVFRKSSGTSSPVRRLAKKITSTVKKLKIFRSSSSVSSLSVSEISLHSDATSESNSPKSLSSHPSGTFPNSRRMCRFSRRLRKNKSADVNELAQNDYSMSQSGSRKCITMRRQKSSESLPCTKWKVARVLSSETLEQYNLSESMPSSASSSLHGKSTSSANAEDAANGAKTSRDHVPWRVVGLLVSLLFLLVGRFPAIMATSLFFVVVSSTYHDQPHPRVRGRDNRALQAARRLQRSSPSGQRWTATSPPRKS